MGVTKNSMYYPVALKKEVTYGTNPSPTLWNPIRFLRSAIPTITRSDSKELVITANGNSLAHKDGITEKAYHYTVDFPATRLHKNDIVFVLQMFFPNYSFATGTHTLKLDTATAKCFQNSYTMLLPYCNCAGTLGAYEVNGLIPQSLTLDLSSATFAMTAIAKSSTVISTSIPEWTGDYSTGDYYLEDSAETGTVDLTPYNVNYDKIQVYDGGFSDSNIINQLTSNVITINFNVNTDRVAKNNGVMANIIKSFDAEGANDAFTFCYDRTDAMHASIIAGGNDITQDYYLKSMIEDGSYTSAVIFDSKVKTADIAGNVVDDLDGVNCSAWMLEGDNSSTITVEIEDDHGDLTSVF